MFQFVERRRVYYHCLRNCLRMKFVWLILFLLILLILHAQHNESASFKIDMPMFGAKHDSGEQNAGQGPIQLVKRDISASKGKGWNQVKKGGILEQSKDEKTGVNSVEALDIKVKFKPWLQNDCKPLKRLFTRKDFLMKRIVQTVEKITRNPDLTLEEKKYQVQTFGIFGKELNETEVGVLESLNWLDGVLKGDYKDFINLQEKSKARLQSLRDAALLEEQEYNIILQAQEGLDKMNKSHITGVMDQLLAEVAKAADDLEESLNENLFNDALKDQKGHGDNVETVIKLRSGEGDGVVKKEVKDGDGKSEEAGNQEENDEEGVIKLVDARDNQFVLSKGSDTTVPHEDHHLIQDVISLMLTSFVFAAACQVFTLPTMFGYVVTGVLLGPSGLNVLQSLVQIETLGEFGAFLILFAVGLEFSPAKLKKVFKIATVGSISMTALLILCGVTIGWLMNATANESVFVAACLSLSSTPLVVKFLSPTAQANGADSPSNTDYGSVLLGILIMQDVLLGLLMALLPNMAAAATSHGTHQAEVSFLDMYGWIALRLLGAMCVVAVAVVIASKYVIGQVYAYIIQQGSKEITVIFSVTLAFITLKFTDTMGVSMELGCFLAGVMVSSQGHQLAQEVENLIQPIKDFLACVFFASIGLHVFPTFLAYQLTFLTTLTLAVVGGKYLISVAVLAVLSLRQSHSTQHIKWIVSAGLSQVSEFSFVLGSRARRLGLISREVYLMILSITTLSLLFAPVLWKATLWKLRIRLTPKVQPVTIASQVLHQSPPISSPVNSADTYSFVEEPQAMRRITLSTPAPVETL